MRAADSKQYSSAAVVVVAVSYALFERNPRCKRRRGGGGKQKTDSVDWLDNYHLFSILTQL